MEARYLERQRDFFLFVQHNNKDAFLALVNEHTSPKSLYQHLGYETRRLFNTAAFAKGIDGTHLGRIIKNKQLQRRLPDLNTLTVPHAEEVMDYVSSHSPRENFLWAIEKDRIISTLMICGICTFPMMRAWLDFDDRNSFNEFIELTYGDKRKLLPTIKALSKLFDTDRFIASLPINKPKPSLNFLPERCEKGLYFKHGHLNLDDYSLNFLQTYGIDSTEALNAHLESQSLWISLTTRKLLKEKIGCYQTHLRVVNVVNDLNKRNQQSSDFLAQCTPDFFKQYPEDIRKDILRLFLYTLDEKQRTPWLFDYFDVPTGKLICAHFALPAKSSFTILSFIEGMGLKRTEFSKQLQNYRKQRAQERAGYTDIPLLPNEVFKPLIIDDLDFPHYVSNMGRIIKGYQKQPVVFSKTHALLCNEMKPSSDQEGRKRINFMSLCGQQCTKYLATIVGTLFVNRPSESHRIIVPINDRSDEVRASHLRWERHNHSAKMRGISKRRDEIHSQEALLPYNAFSAKDWLAFCVKHRLIRLSQLVEKTHIQIGTLSRLLLKQHVDSIVLFIEAKNALKGTNAPATLPLDVHHKISGKIDKAIDNEDVPLLYAFCQLSEAHEKDVLYRLSRINVTKPKDISERLNKTTRQPLLHCIDIDKAPLKPDSLYEQVQQMNNKSFEHWMTSQNFYTKQEMASFIGISYSQLKIMLDRKGYPPERLNPFFSSLLSKVKAGGRTYSTATPSQL